MDEEYIKEIIVTLINNKYFVREDKSSNKIMANDIAEMINILKEKTSYK